MLVTEPASIASQAEPEADIQCGSVLSFLVQRSSDQT